MSDKPLMPIALAAERRLVRLHVWAEFRRQITRVAGAAAASAALRPLVWPLHHQSPSHSAFRALAFAAGGALIATTIVAVRAYRSRPSFLSATRAIDKALGLAEVVASGVAFEKNGRADEMAAFAIDRAKRATDAIPNGNVSKLLVSEPVTQPRFFKLMIAVACAGVLFGAIDRLVIDRALHPVTASENAAADNLDKAAKKIAAEAKADPTKELTPEEQKVLAAAERAVERAKRGDREGAMEALDDMKKAQRELDAQDRDRSKSLRDLRDSLESKGATASQAADAMANDLATAKDQTELDQLAQKMENASNAAKATAQKQSNEAQKAAWQRASDAMKEAHDAAKRGDKAAAQAAMARAQKELSGLERSGRHAGTSKLSSQASALDRSIQAGAQGKEPGNQPGEGQGQGQGKGSDEKKNGDGKGEKGKSDDDKSKGSGGPGGGGGPDDDTPVAPRERLKMNGDLQVRTDVKEGEKAISAIEGVGKGDEGHAYKEIFPAYDTVVEDGLREDNVPAARRPNVRRYFKSIRPGEEPK